MTNEHQDGEREWPGLATDIDTPEFEALWQLMKSWDINVPEQYVGYSGCTGSHVQAILNALKRARLDKAAVEPMPMDAGEYAPIGLEITKDTLWVGTMKLTPFGSKCDDIWFSIDYDKTLTGEAKQRRLRRAKLIIAAINSRKNVKSISDLSPETLEMIEKDCRVADVLAEKMKDSPCHLGQLEDAYHLANIAIETIKELALASLPARRGVSEWRTIDSAPKDNTTVLGWYCARDGNNPELCRVAGVHWCTIDERWNFDVACTPVENSSFHITHWMPLPPTPSEAV